MCPCNRALILLSTVFSEAKCEEIANVEMKRVHSIEAISISRSHKPVTASHKLSRTKERYNSSVQFLESRILLVKYIDWAPHCGEHPAALLQRRVI